MIVGCLICWLSKYDCLSSFMRIVFCEMMLFLVVINVVDDSLGDYNLMNMMMTLCGL